MKRYIRPNDFDEFIEAYNDIIEEQNQKNKIGFRLYLLFIIIIMGGITYMVPNIYTFIIMTVCTVIASIIPK